MHIKQKFTLGIYTRSPMHIGAGSSVDLVDLPIIRERITNYPVIPSTSLKGVLRQHARDVFGFADKNDDAKVRLLYGESLDKEYKDENDKAQSYAGAVYVGEGRLLAFPVRSVKGCFAWVTCPLALQRYQRDTGAKFALPEKNIAPDHCIAGEAVEENNVVVLEEYPYDCDEVGGAVFDGIADELAKLSSDPVWKSSLMDRLVITSDENFQHIVTSTTEIVARIKMDIKTRTNENLFNQENLPSEAMFYAVCSCVPARRDGLDLQPDALFAELFDQNPQYLQIGGDETSGHGLCEVLLRKIGGEA